MLLSELVVIGLASYRLSMFLVHEIGPYRVLETIRYYGQEWTSRELWSCFYCMSTWVALALFLVWEVVPVVVYLLAAMAVATITRELIDAVDSRVLSRRPDDPE